MKVGAKELEQCLSPGAPWGLPAGLAPAHPLLPLLLHLAPGGHRVELLQRHRGLSEGGEGHLRGG